MWLWMYIIFSISPLIKLINLIKYLFNCIFTYAIHRYRIDIMYNDVTEIYKILLSTLEVNLILNDILMQIIYYI